MGDLNENVQAIFYYGVADESIPAEERGFYTFPANTRIQKEKQDLHDWRTSGSEVVHGGKGLDVQGFTYVQHKSELSGDDYITGKRVEEVYFSEVERLLCEVTGASRAIVDGMAVRAKTIKDVKEDPKISMKGDKTDLAIGKIPRNIARVTGRDSTHLIEPARFAHIDYSVNGLRDTARFGRTDIADFAKDVLAAEDAVQRGESVRVPRYAVYSVWRPLDTVMRDPLAVLDWRTTDPSEVVPSKTRALSGVKESGEYIREGAGALPPKAPQDHRWYYMSKQTPDEVLLVKFADTGATEENGIAKSCVHCSPLVAGSDDLPTRRSIEARVLAFWD